MKRGFFILVLFLLLFTACKTVPYTRPAYTFPIPPAHEGPLMLIQDEKCGVLPIREQGKAIHRFDDKGYLIVQKEEVLTARHEFYRVDSGRLPTKVIQLKGFSDSVPGVPVIPADLLRVTSRNVRIKNNVETHRKGGAACLWYWLYNNFKAAVHYLKDPQISYKLDSMTNQIINACRNAR